MSLWIAAGLAFKIGVYAGYTGKIKSKTGIVSTIKDGLDNTDSVTENVDNICEVKELPGFCSDTDPLIIEEDVPDNLNTIIERLYVFSAGI